MLYNPKWEVGTINDLIAWLRTQQSNEEYCYSSNENCLLAQYYHDRWYTKALIAGTYLRKDGVEREPIPENLNSVTIGRPRTFGTALARALVIVEAGS